MSKTEPASPSSNAILQHMSIPGEPGTYVLGCFEGRVTIYSQQIRALNLIYALSTTGALKPGNRVAVIGGGIAGLTAAAGAAQRNADVTLFERRPELLHLQRGCHTRWLHPNIYDWPNKNHLSERTNLPFLNWSAGDARSVVKQLLEQWDKLKTKFRIQEEKGTTVMLRPPEGDRRSLVVTAPKFRNHEYQIIILAVGFGLERTISPQPLRSYWRDDSLHQPEVGWTTSPTRYLISGNGDGGLIDLLRLRLQDFRHEKLAEEINISEALAEKLNTIESEAWNKHARGTDTSSYLHQEYSQLDVPNTVDEMLENRFRQDTKVTFNFPDWPLTISSSVLNRFLVSRLLKHDKNLDTVLGRIVGADGQEPSINVTFASSTGRHTRSYDRIVIKHGPESSLANDFPALNDRIAPVLKARNSLDQTRYPSWTDDFFADDSITTETSTNAQTPSTPASPSDPNHSGTIIHNDPIALSAVAAPQPQQSAAETISADARSLLNQLLEGKVVALDQKLKMLSKHERSFVLESTSERASQDANAMRSLTSLLESESMEQDHAAIVKSLNRTIRSATFSASIDIKAKVLEFPINALKEADSATLSAFFEDIFGIVSRDRFGEVNTIVPRLVASQNAIPENLYKKYFQTLLEQSQSQSHSGAPAAKQGIRTLTAEMARVAINSLDADTLAQGRTKSVLTAFIAKHIHLVDDPTDQNMLAEFLTLSTPDFLAKHAPAEDFPF